MEKCGKAGKLGGLLQWMRGDYEDPDWSAWECDPDDAEEDTGERVPADKDQEASRVDQPERGGMDFQSEREGRC